MKEGNKVLALWNKVPAHKQDRLTQGVMEEMEPQTLQHNAVVMAAFAYTVAKLSDNLDAQRTLTKEAVFVAVSSLVSLGIYIFLDAYS